MRTLLIGALAATLVGCGHQPAAVSCTGANGLACLERTAGPPIKLASFRINSTAPNGKPESAWKGEKPPFTQPPRGRRLAGKTAKSTGIAARAEGPTTRIPLQADSSKGRLELGSAAADSKTTGANIAEPHPTVGAADADARRIEARVAAATVLAERITVATVNPSPDIKPGNGDRSSRAETLGRGHGENNAPASANDTYLLIAVVMTRSDIKSVSDLIGAKIAIGSMHSMSQGSVRTAIVAAGAPGIQLSEGQTTAINRLVNGEVPAAVLALVSTDAANGFPEIAGFNIFQIPLSPRSDKARS